MRNFNMKINLNSSDGNMLVILGKITSELYKYYPKEDVNRWVQKTLYKRTYQQIIDKIQEDWVFWDKAEPLKFYKSTEYEMERKKSCI